MNAKLKQYFKECGIDPEGIVFLPDPSRFYHEEIYPGFIEWLLKKHGEEQ